MLINIILININLARIAQGKYIKSEFSVIIQPNQEIILKTIALETLVELLQNLQNFFEEFDKDSNTDYNKKDEKGSEMEDIESVPEDNMSKIDNFDSVEKNRLLKLQMQKGIQKFNFKPEHGVRFLFSNGFVKEKK